MSKDRWTIVAALALVLLPLVLARRLHGPINAHRADLQLTTTDVVEENLPPDIAFTTAFLGSFRGLAVDALWYRANELQNEGKYYEAIQLSDWITRLQPRFPRVWAFHAWNLSYNISEAVHTPEEKWMWVQEGVRLLRDRGIPLNPKNPLLYKELAYILFHKIGRYTVDTHWYYKRCFAEEWQILLGAPPEGTTKEALEAFRKMAEAPNDVDQLRGLRPGLAEEIAHLKDMGFGLDLDLLERISVIRAHMQWAQVKLPDTISADASPVARLVAWLSDAQKSDAREALLATIRKSILRKTYHMDPSLMLELMEKFGPIDWRHPSAHAVYWSIRGAREGYAARNPDLFEVLQNDRTLLSALRTLAFEGRIHFDAATGYYNQTADPRMFDGFEVVLTEIGRRHGDPSGQPPQALRENHRGFLEWAAREAYLFGNLALSEAYYSKLRDQYGAAYPDTYMVDLKTFVMDQLVKGGKRLDQVQSAVYALILRALTVQYADQDTKLAKSLKGFAESLYKNYQGKVIREETGERQQFDMPPMNTIISECFSRFMTLPFSAMPPSVKAKAWQNFPLRFKQEVYDRIKKSLYEESNQWGLDPLKVFPEPPDMDAFRKSRAQAPDPNALQEAREKVDNDSP